MGLLHRHYFATLAALGTFHTEPSGSRVRTRLIFFFFFSIFKDDNKWRGLDQFAMCVKRQREKWIGQSGFVSPASHRVLMDYSSGALTSALHICCVVLCLRANQQRATKTRAPALRLGRGNSAIPPSIKGNWYLSPLSVLGPAALQIVNTIYRVSLNVTHPRLKNK